MASVPGSLPDGLNPSDFGPAVPVGAGLSSSPPKARPVEADAKLPEGLNPADFGPPVETYRSVGAEPTPTMPTNPLYSALTRSRGVSPDHVADVLKLSQKTGLDVGAVERNLPEVKSLAEFDPTQIDDFMARNPKATAWLQDGGNFALAKDDLPNLGGLEQAFARSSQKPDELAQRNGLDWLLAAGGQVLGQSHRSLAVSELRTQQLFGDTSPETQARIDALKAQERPTPKTDGLLQDVYVNTLSLLPQFASQARDRIYYGIQGGMGAGGAAALGSAMTGPAAPGVAVISVPTAFVTGFGIAQAFGGAKNAFTMEAGGAYDEYRDIKGIDDDTAKVAAFLVGAANGGIEYAQMSMLLKTIPGGDSIKQMLTRQGMREALAVPSVRAALSSFAKGYGKTLTLETAQEVLQEAITFLGGQAVRQDAGLDMQGWDEFGERMKDTAYQAATGFAVLTGSGHAMTFGRDVGRAKQAQRMSAAFDEISKLSGESKLNARLPEAYQDYVEHVRRETGGVVPEKVYVSAQRLAEAVVDTGADGGDTSAQADGQVLAQFFQSIGVTPEEAQQRAALNQDIAIPFALYQSKIAPTKMGQDLANDVRFTHDGMTRNEAVEFEKEFQGRVQAELAAQEQNRAQHDTDLSQVIGEYKGELARVGVKGKDADAQLQLLSSGANVAAARWTAIKGETVTPAQWLREVRGLQIRAVEQGQTNADGALNQAAMCRSQLADPVEFARAVREDHSAKKSYFEYGAVPKAAAAKGGRAIGRDISKAIVVLPSDTVAHGEKNHPGMSAERYAGALDIMENADEATPGDSRWTSFGGKTMVFASYQGGVGHVVVAEHTVGKRAGERLVIKTIFSDAEASVRAWVNGQRGGAKEEGLAASGSLADTQAQPEGRNDVQDTSSSVGNIIPGDEEVNALKQSSRGSISFTGRGTFISLFKGAANLSTLPHEFGHLFVNDLEAMVATGRAPESVVKDLETLKGFAGDLSTTEAQEKLARAFEAYLREGKAPSAELRTAFQRFAAWLTAIYRDIRALVGPDGLSDEVRGVFDRMLASEDEIAAAEAYYGAKETLERIATDMLTDAEKKRISELRGASHAAALEKRIKRYLAAYLKALGGKQALEAEARAEVEAQPVYAAADEAVASGGLSYADVAQELGGVVLIPEMNKRRPGLVRDNSTFNAQLRKQHEEALASLRKSQKQDVGEQRNFLSEMFEEGLKYNMAWRLKSYFLYGADPLGEHASPTMPDKSSKHRAATTVGLDYEDAVYHFGRQGIEGIQVGLVKRGGIKIDALMQEWGLSSADEVRDALHFNRGALRETFVSSGLTELNQDVPEFRQNKTVGVTLPEVLALKHGFDSAEHLLMEILKSQNKGEAIKELVGRKLSEKENALRERLGEETVPGEEDVHSDEALERLATEAKALERQIYATAGAKIKVTKPVNAAASREVARAVLEGMTLADARDYRRFAAAERRAGLEVVKAVKAQKWQKALAAKQREAINHALVLESVQLRDEVNKELSFVKRVAKSKSMRFEAKEQFLSLVQAYQLGTESMTPERPGELAELSEFLKAAFEGDLFNPFDAFPDWLLQKQKAGHHRNLLTADFREVTYLMRSLADVGGSETMKMVTEDKSYEQKAAECAAPIMASGQKATKVDDATPEGQRREKFRWAMASLNFQRDILRKADGYVDLGPANSHKLGPNQGIHERIQKATSAMLRMLQGHEKPMREVAKVRQAFTERFRQQYGELAPTLNGVEVPGALKNIGRNSWTAERVWTLARNIGNGGNRRCIIEGYGLDWDNVQKLMAVLTRDELLAIQREGEIIGAHYHEADKTFRAVYHRPMAQRIEYQPFTIQAADGPVQLNGWYFPIKVDPALNPNVADRAQADIMQSEPAHGAFPPNPRKSFTNARTGTALPVALSFDVFERGLSEQARFIHLAPILKDADRVFRQAEYREAYTDAFGRHAYKEIRMWLKNIATPVMEQAGAFDSVLDKGRRLSSVWILAWNLKSALKQELGLFPAMKEIGSLSVLRGLKTLAPHGETTIEAINALSPRMKNRDAGIDQEQREILAKARNETMKLGFGKHKLSLKVTQHDVLQFSMSLQRLFDKHVTYSVWAGAYIKGQQYLGMSQADAVDYADRIVERTQVTNTDAAMNALQRSRGGMRVFTMFMSEALPKGSRTRVDFNALKAGRLSYAQYARSVFYEFVGPALFNAAALTMLAGAAPDEPKDYFWALWNEVLGVFPVLSGVAGAFLYGRGVGDTPLFTGLELQLKAAAKAAKIPIDMENLDNWAALFLAMFDVAAFSAGVGNLRRGWQDFAQGWEDISNEETKNPLRLFLKKPKGH